ATVAPLHRRGDRCAVWVRSPTTAQRCNAATLPGLGAFPGTVAPARRPLRGVWGWLTATVRPGPARLNSTPGLVPPQAPDGLLAFQPVAACVQGAVGARARRKVILTAVARGHRAWRVIGSWERAACTRGCFTGT